MGRKKNDIIRWEDMLPPGMYPDGSFNKREMDYYYSHLKFSDEDYKMIGQYYKEHRKELGLPEPVKTKDIWKLVVAWVISLFCLYLFGTCTGIIIFTILGLIPFFCWTIVMICWIQEGIEEENEQKRKGGR